MVLRAQRPSASMLLVLVLSPFSSLSLLGALVVERHLMLTRWVLKEKSKVRGDF